MVGQDWIQEEILGFTPEERNQHKSTIKQDVLFQKELESIAVSAENQERQATMDPFDQSNYAVPGGGVPRTGAQPGSPGQAGQVTDQELLAGISSFDTNGNIIRNELPPGTGPVAPTPLATQRRRNEKRRVGMGGDFNLQTPDFKRMLDMGGDNVYNTDINDNEYLKTRKNNESIDMVKTLRRAPELSNSMKRLFELFDKKHNIVKKTFIMEDLEQRLEEALEQPEPKPDNELAEFASLLLEDKQNIDFQLIDESSKDAKPDFNENDE